jgi:hypothetical protein
MHAVPDHGQRAGEKGMAEIRPICRLFWMPISLMMDGDQKAIVALPLTMQKYTAAHSQTR